MSKKNSSTSSVRFSVKSLSDDSTQSSYNSSSTCQCEEIINVTSHKKLKSTEEYKSLVGKFYYTDDEVSFLKNLKQLFKKKSFRRRHKLCSCNLFEEAPEKLPETDCQIRVEAWAKHDNAKCSFEKGYYFIGDLLFPICCKSILEPCDGVLIRRSPKSFTINDSSEFRKNFAENRKYAYPDMVLVSQCMCSKQN